MCYFWKVLARDQIRTVRHARENFKSKYVIVIYSKKFGHEKQLAEHVQEVEYFAKYIQYDEKISEPLSGPKAQKAENTFEPVAHLLFTIPIAVFGLNEFGYVT